MYTTVHNHVHWRQAGRPAVTRFASASRPIFVARCPSTPLPIIGWFVWQRRTFAAQRRETQLDERWSVGRPRPTDRPPDSELQTLATCCRRRRWQRGGFAANGQSASELSRCRTCRRHDDVRADRRCGYICYSHGPWRSLAPTDEKPVHVVVRMWLQWSRGNRRHIYVRCKMAIYRHSRWRHKAGDCMAYLLDETTLCEHVSAHVICCPNRAFRIDNSVAGDRHSLHTYIILCRRPSSHPFTFGCLRELNLNIFESHWLIG
jgi:hypothetical protein